MKRKSLSFVPGFVIVAVLLLTSCAPTGTTAPPTTTEPAITTPTPTPTTEPTPSSTPTPTATPTPTPTPTSTPVSTATADDWGSWGRPIWPPEYKATPGAWLLFFNGTMLAHGLPKDKVYYLWQCKLDTGPVRNPVALSIDSTGMVVRWEDQKTASFSFGDFARGEALQFALISEDKTVMVFYKDIPYPLEARVGNYHIWVELWSPKGDQFIIWGEGFGPDEEIRAISDSYDEVVESKVKVDSKGRFMTIVLPGIAGQESGFAAYSAVGRSGEVKVWYQWGPPALRPGP